jgi:hypothetical protein
MNTLIIGTLFWTLHVNPVTQDMTLAKGPWASMRDCQKYIEVIDKVEGSKTSREFHCMSTKITIKRPNNPK